MAYPFTINGHTYTAASFWGMNYLTAFPDLAADMAAVASQVVADAAAQQITAFVSSTGTASAYAIAPTPDFAGPYTAGNSFRFKAHADCAAQPTLDVSGVGAVEMRFNGVALSALDIRAGDVVTVTYDGTYFQLDAIKAKSGVVQVPTIADLRLRRGGMVVWVRGYYTDADGGEGHFWLDGSDAVSADDGLTVIVDAAGNRWKRNTGGLPLTAAMAGAKGDNSNDDTAALAALLAATPTRGIAILNANKTYKVAGAPALSITGKVLSGYGAGMHLSGAGIAITVGIGAIIKGIAFTGDWVAGATTDARAISGQFGGYNVGHVEDCTFSGFYYGIYDGYSLSYVRGCRFSSNFFGYTNRGGAPTAFDDNKTIEHCWFNGNGDTATFTAASFTDNGDGTGTITVADNTGLAAYYPIEQAATGAYAWIAVLSGTTLSLKGLSGTFNTTAAITIRRGGAMLLSNRSQHFTLRHCFAEENQNGFLFPQVAGTVMLEECWYEDNHGIGLLAYTNTTVIDRNTRQSGAAELVGKFIDTAVKSGYYAQMLQPVYKDDGSIPGYGFTPGIGVPIRAIGSTSYGVASDELVAIFGGRASLNDNGKVKQWGWVVHSTNAANDATLRLGYMTNSSSDRGGLEPLAVAGTLVEWTKTAYRPTDDNAKALGGASNRWSTVYAGTGAINTSDRTEKQDFAPLDDALLDAFEAIDPTAYRFKDAVALKGDAARIHLGYIAQDLHAALLARGLDPACYAIWCQDDITEEYGVETVVADPETGEEVTVIEKREGVIGHRQGLRYNQFIALLDASTRRRFARIEARLAALEALS